MRFAIPALLALLSLAPAAQAQTRFGFGVSVNPSRIASPVVGDDFTTAFYPAPVSIYLPITFGGFRLEPEVGVSRVAYSSEITFFGGEDEDTAEVESALTSLQIGTGAFFLQPVESGAFYAGARGGLLITSISQEYSGFPSEFEAPEIDESGTGFFIAPAVGGEYFFGEHFSLGLEAQLMLAFPEAPVDAFEEEEGDGPDITTLDTRGLFFARWHF